MGENTIVNVMNPASSLKALKTPVEMENIRKAHVKDGVAVTRFVYWLKKNIGKIPMDEVSVAEKLESFRKEQEGYIGAEFPEPSPLRPECRYVPLSGQRKKISLRSTAKRHVPRGFRRTVLWKEQPISQEPLLSDR